VSPLGRPTGDALGPRSLDTPSRYRPLRLPRQHRATAWVLAVAGPAVITLGLLPFKSTFRTAGVLFCTLLVVVAVGVLGGVRPALLAVVLGFLSGAFFFAPPYRDPSAGNPIDLVALIAFVVVGGSVGVLVDDLTTLVEEQTALRRVATLVARAAPPEELFAVVTEEVGRHLRVDQTRMGRYHGEGMVTIVAGWSRAGGDVPLEASRVLDGRNISTFVSETGRPARMDSYADATGAVADDARKMGFRSAVGAPIVVHDHLWGVMIAASTSARRMPGGTEARLAAFTDLVATAIANAESQADLAASRARIVATADETRRRIERDLHDGAQQRLVSLALALGSAQTTVPAELVELKEELAAVVEGLAKALEDLQEIARGIHPAILAEGGLRPALKNLARRSPIPVELDIQAASRLPRPVEVAAYYVVSETLTNAAKYAHATVIRVDVEAIDRALRVCVRDDGDGGADPTRGSGLIGLRDRVEALGGAITVQSPPGAGTSVEVKLPFND
jgi:signal transduction histidine kinase